MIDTISQSAHTNLYKVKVGDTFEYTGLFGDGITTKYEITEIPKNDLGLDYTVIAINDQSPSFNKFQLGAYSFKVSMLDSNDKPVVSNYAVGYGDARSASVVRRVSRA